MSGLGSAFLKHEIKFCKSRAAQSSSFTKIIHAQNFHNFRNPSPSASPIKAEKLVSNAPHTLTMFQNLITPDLYN
jgi:hypothetical protein